MQHYGREFRALLKEKGLKYSPVQNNGLYAHMLFNNSVFAREPVAEFQGIGEPQFVRIGEDEIFLNGIDSLLVFQEPPKGLFLKVSEKR